LFDLHLDAGAGVQEGLASTASPSNSSPVNLLGSINWQALATTIDLTGQTTFLGSAAMADVCSTVLPRHVKSVAIVGNGPMDPEDRRCEP
jgi:hypothetical protein